MFECPHYDYICISLALDFFKTAHNHKSYNLVRCWRGLKDYDKWKQTYATYKRSLNNGTASATIDLKEEDKTRAPSPLSQGPTRPPIAISKVMLPHLL
jgi:hypothetical protein